MRKNIKILKDNKVPVLFIAKPRGIVVEATKHCLEVFNENSENFERAFLEDIRDMCDPARPADVQADEIKLMKSPLSRSNYHEVKVFIRYLILRDPRIRLGRNQTKIKYGDPTWRPSFWPNEMYCWVTHKKNFSNVRNCDIPGDNSMLDVLREAIKEKSGSK